MTHIQYSRANWPLQQKGQCGFGIIVSTHNIPPVSHHQYPFNERHKTDYACTAMPTACLCEGVTSFISNTMITHEKIIKLATAPESRAIFSRGEGRAGWRDGEPRTNEPSNVDSLLCVFWSHTLKVKIAHGSEARTRRKSCAHSVISSWLDSALDSGADSGV